MLSISTVIQKRAALFAVAVLGLSNLQAASLPYPGKLLSFSAKESYTDYVYSYKDSETRDTYTEQASKGTTTVSFSMALGQENEETFEIEGLDLSTITSETAFSFNVGEALYEGTLEMDPNIDTNLPKRRAIIPLGYDDETGEPSAAYASIKLSWTATKLTVTSVFPSTESNIYLSNVLGVEPGTSETVRGKAAIMINFGPVESSNYYSDGLDGYVSGTTKTVIKTVGKGESAMEFELSSASLSVVLDTAPPKITLLPPKGGFVAKNGMVTLKGKVTDAYGVPTLYYFNPNAEEYVYEVIDDINIIKGIEPEDGLPDWWGPAEVEWEATLPVVEGVNEFEIDAYDQSSNYASVPVKVIEQVSDVNVGQWVGLMDPEAGGGGGYISFTVTSTGSVSGKLSLEGGLTKSLTGIWHGPHFHAAIDKGKSSELYVSAYADGESVEDVQLVIDVTDNFGDYSFSGIAFRAPYSTTNKIPADNTLLGQFNVQIGQPEETSLGYGYFSMIIANKGINTVAGRLADGTAFTASGLVGAAGQLPFFTHLYKSGAFQSSQSTLDSNSLNIGNAYWSRPPLFSDKQLPDGIWASLPTNGSRYIAPGAGERILNLGSDISPIGVVATWLGDEVIIEESQEIFISNKNGISVTDGAAFTGKVDAKKSLVTGSFKLQNDATRVATYSGMIVGDSVVGHYILPPEKGTGPEKGFGKFRIALP